MQTVSMSKVIRRKKSEAEEVVIPEFEERKVDLLMRIQARKEFRSLAEKIAGDSLFYRNYYYPGGREFFANDQGLLTVEKYFPYAEGGPLYVDEPMMPYQEEECAKKTVAFKTLKLRYLVIKRGMNELDCIEAIA